MEVSRSTDSYEYEIKYIESYTQKKQSNRRERIGNSNCYHHVEVEDVVPFYSTIIKCTFTGEQVDYTPSKRPLVLNLIKSIN